MSRLPPGSCCLSPSAGAIKTGGCISHPERNSIPGSLLETYGRAIFPAHASKRLGGQRALEESGKGKDEEAMDTHESMD